MIIMRMEYDNTALMSGKATLHTYRMGKFSVFSGRGSYINNPNCTDKKDYGAIPTGQYYIVDRPTGSTANMLRMLVQDAINGTSHNAWFGLYSATTMSDHAFVNGTRRGAFRLHPLRPDGSGESWGRITFFSTADFALVRNELLKEKKQKVPGSSNGLMCYGRIDVRGKSDFAKCNF